jgi:glycosyltransferase involved in cell wall biosynthesis
MGAVNLSVLMIAEQCNPTWASVPLVSYNFYREISKIVDVTLVTHMRNRDGFSQHPEHANITFIEESPLTKRYHESIVGLVEKGRANWPLYNALAYPVYAEFNRKVFQLYKDDVLSGKYDIIHSITPMMPRYPVKMVQFCKETPLLLGPVNGGVPFPQGFRETAKKESVFWNFLRPFGRYLVPGYIETYQKTNRILSGSTYTLNMLKKLFKIPDNRIELLYENGLSKRFLEPPQKVFNDKVQLLFVGRLVPYKGTDMVIEAIGRLAESVKSKISLTIVGDGSERQLLEQRVQELNLNSIIQFTGWIEQSETYQHYSKSDVFCFPSIREFGGAVVMEAMACGLPCIVVNNGGIGEYVTDETGFRIEPISREYVIQELASNIQILVENKPLREKMSSCAIEEAQKFEWSHKAKRIVEIYNELLQEKQGGRG